MESFLKQNNVDFEQNKIKLPTDTERVKIDIGLSYN